MVIVASTAAPISTIFAALLPTVLLDVIYVVDFTYIAQEAIIVGQLIQQLIIVLSMSFACVVLSCGIDLPCSFPIFVRLLFSCVTACSKESSKFFF